jgi:ppGpp synthetase/RelA/SpoT-type nucleotidyltranferase
MLQSNYQNQVIDKCGVKIVCFFITKWMNIYDIWLLMY